MQYLLSYVHGGVDRFKHGIYQSELWHGWNRESPPRYSLAVNARGGVFGMTPLAAFATREVGESISVCADVELMEAPVTLPFDVDPLDPRFDSFEYRGRPKPGGKGPIEAWAEMHRVSPDDPRIGRRVVVLPRVIYEYEEDGSIPIDERGCRLLCERVHLNPPLVERHGFVATFPGLLLNARVYEIVRAHVENCPFVVVNRFDV